MIPLPWILVAILAALAAGGWGGFSLGGEVARSASVEARALAADKFIVKREKELVVSHEVETKYIQSVQTVHTHTEEIRHEISQVVSGDCTLPSDFMRSLRALSRGRTVATSAGAEDARAGADCRSTLDVLARSYANHYADAEQLNAVLKWEDEVGRIR